MSIIHLDGSSASPLQADLAAFSRRLAATPPGQCPVVLLTSFLETCAAQTCGKCVPCRDGLPQLAQLVARVARCEAEPSDLERIRSLAQWIMETADCAIGWEAAETVLRHMQRHSSEFAAHAERHACETADHQTVPCETLCPAHVDVPGYIALAAAGDCAGAVVRIRRDNPFPTACAFVCEHPCEKRCRRTLLDAPVNIRAIKRYAVDHAPADTVPVPRRLPNTGRRIAIVGAGPAGMTCAYYLALMGHRVEVFEEKQRPGGMMRYGIPAYRLPRERLDEDLRAVLRAGDITLHTRCRVDEAMMKSLRDRFDAVFLAIGAHLGKSLSMPGADARGVYSAVELLRDIGDGRHPDFTGRKVAVIGGGNVAMDCVRTAMRAGAEEVNLIYRRRREDMTALTEEIEAAVAEGVEMLTLRSPVAVEKSESGQCLALLLQPQRISAYVRDRAAAVPADRPRERLPADVVLIAVGQEIDAVPFEAAGLPVRRGAIVTDDALAVPGHPGIFAGGDCQSGPATVIKAIAAGKAAARNIDEYLGFHHALENAFTMTPPLRVNRTPTGRVALAERPVKLRKRDFACTEIGMTGEEALQEARRCLRCDHFGCGSMINGRMHHA